MITVTTAGYTPALQDNTVQLLKLGAPVGSNKALGTIPGPPRHRRRLRQHHGRLPGTTWTPARTAKTSTFGLRFAAKNTGSASPSRPRRSTTSRSRSATTRQPTDRIAVRRSSSSMSWLVHVPPSSSAHAVHREGPHLGQTSTTTSAANNPALVTVGRLRLLVEERDARSQHMDYKDGHASRLRQRRGALRDGVEEKTTGNTTGPNHSLKNVNGEFAPVGVSYVCQVWSDGASGGTLLGRALVECDHSRADHLRDDFRRRQLPLRRGRRDRQLQGRATSMSSTDANEIDAVVCADGNVASPPTTPTACVDKTAGVSTCTDPTKNMMVLMSEGNATPPTTSTTRAARPAAGTLRPPVSTATRPAVSRGSSIDRRLPDPPELPGQRHLRHDLIPRRERDQPELLHLPVDRQPTHGQKSDTTTATMNFELDRGDTWPPGPLPTISGVDAPSSESEAGFGLIELVISMVIMQVVLLGLLERSERVLRPRALGSLTTAAVADGANGDVSRDAVRRDRALTRRALRHHRRLCRRHRGVPRRGLQQFGPKNNGAPNNIFASSWSPARQRAGRRAFRRTSPRTARTRASLSDSSTAAPHGVPRWSSRRRRYLHRLGLQRGRRRQVHEGGLGHRAQLDGGDRACQDPGVVRLLDQPAHGEPGRAVRHRDALASLQLDVEQAHFPLSMFSTVWQDRRCPERGALLGAELRSARVGDRRSHRRAEPRGRSRGCRARSASGACAAARSAGPIRVASTRMVSSSKSRLSARSASSESGQLQVSLTRRGRRRLWRRSDRARPCGAASVSG